MKKSLLAVFVLVSVCANAQTLDWKWAKSAGGTFTDQGNTISTDNSGNVFVAGSFASPQLSFDTTTLISAGGYDMFITKYDNNGNVLWAKSAGGTDNDISISLAVDGAGNVYVTGYFSSSTIAFGATTLTRIPGTNDIFIVKYSGYGDLVWAKHASGNGDIIGNGIVADNSGNIYVTGQFSSNRIILGTDTLSSNSYDDIFIAKYDTSGNVLWAKGAGGTNTDFGSSIACDGNGNVYVTGAFESDSIVFGATAIITSNHGSYDVFVAKYDSIGNSLWAKSVGGTSTDVSNYSACDHSGNVYVVGNFSSSALLFDTTTLTNGGGENIFVVKYDNGGNILWAKGASGGFNAVASSVAISGSGSVYVTGSFMSTFFTFGTITLMDHAGDDIFIAKYDSGGSVLWATGIGDIENDYSAAIAIDNSGSIYITGDFKSQSVAFGSDTLTNAGQVIYSDIFTAKLREENTGISQFSIPNSQFSIYPNPATNSVTITVDESMPGSTLTVYDITGKKMAAAQLRTSDTRLPTIEFSNGIYFVTIENEKGRATKKLVIQK